MNYKTTWHGIISRSFMIVCSMFVCHSAVGQQTDFIKSHCLDCHDSNEKKGGLDLSALKLDLSDAENFSRWVKIYDRVTAGEMPPKDAERPPADEAVAFTKSLRTSLVAADQANVGAERRAGLRRLTRVEYENTIRDLFDMPGIALHDSLPADGTAHGFDTNSEALNISHVNLAKYLEAADQVLDFAIATQPKPPIQHTQRIPLSSHYYVQILLASNGGAVLFKDKQPDPDFPATSVYQHLDQGAHQRFGLFDAGSSVGVFRHEDESFRPSFQRFAAIYPGRYRIRTSLWSYQWDQGKVLPSRGVEAVRLSAVQLTNQGLGQDHPSYVIGYFNAPSLESQTHEFVQWLNPHETIGYNVASLAPVHIYHQFKRNAMSFTGPGIACDGLEIEGPLHDVWPTRAHRLLFGDLPLSEFKPAEHPDVRPPARQPPRQTMIGAQNRPDPGAGLWTVSSQQPLEDADRLLATFLPKAFRRPVDEAVRKQYVAQAEQRLKAGDCFETAMRWVYRAALCSPDFLFHIEGSQRRQTVGSDESAPTKSVTDPRSSERGYKIDDHALACRMSYFLWNSMPDDRLTEIAASGKLRTPAVLHGEITRMLQDSKSQRFVKDFPGQWLSLRKIAATDPDRKLYPEFNPYLQDAMVAETRAYFRELIECDLDASHLIRSDFAMLNEKLAMHYGIPGVSGSQIRRVPLPADCPRGGFLTQGSILKITANGTTTSPVPRGAFVMDRLLGQPPEPPPANIPAVEPDVRGATTIREQLAKHRNDSSCASCHAKIDPPGFALEAFDVIGRFRNRYRSIGDGDPAERGSIDPFIGISFKLGPSVESHAELPDGRAFKNIREYQSLVAADATRLLRNLAQQFAVYAIGRAMRFSDRPAIDEIVRRTQARGGGIRSLIHELIASPLFTGDAEGASVATLAKAWEPKPTDHGLASLATKIQLRPSMLMTATLPDVAPPAVSATTPSPVNEPAGSFEFSDDHTVNLQVTGLFIPERVDTFRTLFNQFPEAKLSSIDFKTASSSITYAADSELFRGAKPEQIVERLNNRVRQLSGHTIGLKSLSAIPRENLEQVDIPIFGLDCQGCALAAYETLAKIEGVERATASFRGGLATAWIDPAKTNRAALEEALKNRGVQLKAL